MPWINLTLRQGALPKAVQHSLMAKLTDVLMWWEKVPDTPRARSIMKGWVYEVTDWTVRSNAARAAATSFAATPKRSPTRTWTFSSAGSPRNLPT